MNKVLKKELAKSLKQKMKSENLTQKDIQVATGVSQPTISRACRGSWKNFSEQIKKLCLYTDIDWQTQNDPAQSILLMDALRTAWDGTKVQEEILANIIRNIGKL